MRKVFKVFLSAISFIIVVCVIAIGLIIYFIDPNTLKPMIISEVNKQTGYHLVIDGKMTWTVYPHLAVNIPHMTITEPAQTQPFLDLKAVKLATPLTDLLHGIKNISGDLLVSEIIFMKMHLHDAKIAMHWKNQVLSLNPITANLYDGTLSGVANGSKLNAQPNWSFNAKLNHIQLRNLLADLNAKNKLQLSGLGQIDVQGTSKGKSKDEVIGNLNGNAHFSADQGKVEGINLDYFIQSADALLNKRRLELPSNLNETQFEKLSASAVIVNGVVKTQDILLQSRALTSTGAGNINLANNTIDMELTIKAIQQSDSTRTIPPLNLNVKGSLLDPNVNVDMREVEKMVTKEVIDRLKNRVEDKISNLLGH